MRLSLIAPEPVLTDRAFVRIHNRAAKSALEEQAIKHWKERIPDHFDEAKQGKYPMAERSPEYQRIKERRYGRKAKLVKTGRTRTAMTRNRPTIRLGGRAANPDGTAGSLRLTMILKFPFTVTSDASQRGVTGDQMRREIGVILPEEARQIIEGFEAGYVKHLNRELASRPRIRKRYEAAGAT